MPTQFFYKAMDEQGRIIQGQIGANNVSDLEVRLERMGLDLIHYRTKKPSNLHIGKVSRQELISFCFHMEHLSRAGVPLLDGLGDLRDSLPQGRFREVIANVSENIQGGEHLSQAMSNFPDIFDKVFVNLVNAGEASGRLADVFQHLTESLKWHDEMIAKTKKALLYPAVMAIVITGALFFLMIYLVPQLVTFITEVGGKELPLETRLLIYISNTFVEYWYIILFAPFLFFFLFKIALKMSHRLRFTVDRLKLRFWLIGPIMEKVILARFANYFALLYRSGIPVIQGLEISSGTAGNLVIEDALQRVRDNIIDGNSITQSFERVNLFPPLVLRMVRIGETTGELDVSLLNVSYFYDREAKEKIDRLQSLIEPGMTVILGIILAWIIFSIMGPIYNTIVEVSGGLNEQQKLIQDKRSPNRKGPIKFTDD